MTLCNKALFLQVFMCILLSSTMKISTVSGAMVTRVASNGSTSSIFSVKDTVDSKDTLSSKIAAAVKQVTTSVGGIVTTFGIA